MSLDKAQMQAHIEGEIKDHLRAMKIKESLSFLECCNNQAFDTEKEMQDLRVTARAIKIAEDIAIDMVKKYII